MRSEITAVLFDWDFTLAYSLTTDITHIQRLATLFRKSGVERTDAEIETAVLSLRQDIENNDISGSLYPQKRREIIHQYRQLLTRLNHSDTSYEFAYRLYSNYALLPHTLYPDVLPTLIDLQEKGFQLGILSNHSRTVRQVIEKLLGESIELQSIVVSEEVGVHKPAKSIFGLAARRMETAPEHCAYVGDNLTVDATGAVVSGNFGLGVWLDRRNTGKTLTLPPNVKRITTLAHLTELL